MSKYSDALEQDLLGLIKATSTLDDIFDVKLTTESGEILKGDVAVLRIRDDIAKLLASDCP